MTQCLLYVSGAPKISSFIPATTIIQPGDTLLLECRGDGPPQPTTQWSRLGGTSFRAIRTTKPGILYIIKTSKKHEGIYRCMVENDFGRVTRITSVGKRRCTKHNMHYLCMIHLLFCDQFLSVVVPVLKFLSGSPSSDLISRTGESLVINCAATVAHGFPVADVQWSVPCGRSLIDYETDRNGSLMIRKASKWDTGMYTCTVRAFRQELRAKVHVAVPEGID